MTTNENNELNSALQALATISARWAANDLPNNPVRRALNTLWENEENDPSGNREPELFYAVERGEFSREDALEALARFYGADEEGREVNEDGSRR